MSSGKVQDIELRIESCIVEGGNLKSLNLCKASCLIDDDKKSQFIVSDLILYQPTTNWFEVRYNT